MSSYSFAERPTGPGAPLLLLFHGTGGDEHQFTSVGAQLAEGAHLIAPRGDVSESGALRFFKRLTEGVYDMPDLARATDKMAAFIRAAIAANSPSSVLAMGYSNGANILASVLFNHPDLVDKAALLHPMIPFAPGAQPGLAGTEVLITSGRRDTMGPPAATEALAAYLKAQGAVVDLVWHEGGHDLRQNELVAARDLFSR
jgi:phospholipase/carboxylesterase